MTTDNIAYGTSTAITCTMASLASSSTVGRQCTVVDNSSNKFVDALVTIGAKTNGSSPSGDKAVYVYFFGSEDGTLYEADDAQPGASDAAYTVNSPSNFRMGVINCPTASKQYVKVFSLLAIFGYMPKKWGFVIVNATGNALDSTEGNHQKTYAGVTFTNT